MQQGALRGQSADKGTTPNWNQMGLGGYGTRMKPRPIFTQAKPLLLLGFRVLAVVALMALLPGCPPPATPPVGPLALFSATPLSGDAPLEVTFSDESNPGSSAITFRRWDFGDGTVSTEENPVHIYEEEGDYTVTLTIATVAGVDRRTRAAYIQVDGETAPRANFTSDKRAGNAPLSVDFSDRSAAGTSEIISWAWDFGDGNTSTEEDPTHIYTTIGVFDVSLTIETAVGEDTETKGAFIVVHSEDLAFGGPAADRAFGLASTADGRHVLAGDTESPEDGSRDIYLVITDAFGNAGTEKRFGGEDDESAAALIPAGDGGFFIAGTVDLDAGGSDAVLVRTDASGNRLWSTTYGGLGDERALAIAPAIDGGALLAGLSAEDEIAGTLAWATRVDADGRVRWTRTFGGGSFTGAVARGSGFVLCGNAASGLDARAIKIDAQGGILWDTPLGGDGVQEASAIAAQAEGYVVVGANTTGDAPSDAWAVIVGEDGTPGWSQVLGGDFADRANAAAVAEDGTIALAGSTRKTATTLDDAYVATLTPLGDVAWEKSFGGNLFADRAHALLADDDGGYSVAGSTESFGLSGTNMYLLKVNADGEQQPFPLD